MIGEAFFEGRLWVPLVAQATCCVAAGLGTSYLWRHRAARAYQILLAGLFASLAMPASYMLVRHLGWGMLTPNAPVDSAGVMEIAASPPLAADTDSVEPDEANSSEGSLVFDPTEPDAAGATAIEPRDVSTKTPRWTLFVACWLVTTTVLLGRLVRQFVLGLRLLRRTQPVEADDICGALEQAKKRIGIRRPVRLRFSRDVRSPLIWCWRRVPVLLVHEQASHPMPRCDWAGIFCHELAHWRRLDHLHGLFCELLLCAVPWHPLLWWARNRLMMLSEQACDDWVLTAGQVGVDYAESLLDLSPQRQMAFLPTVVGKEKAMKERIRRIVKDKCANPRAGARWALAVAAVVAGSSVTVALAQPRPPVMPDRMGPPQVDRPVQPPDSSPRQRRLVIQGRRNVLNRMLDSLRDQQRQVQAELQERGDVQDDQTVILRAELTVIRNHIQAVERQLQEAEQPGALRPAFPGAGPLQRPGPAPRRAQVQERIRQIEQELQDIENQQGDEAGQLRRELRQLHAEIQQLDREAPPAQPQQAPIRPPAQFGPSQPNPAPVRPQVQLQQQVRQLQNQVNNLNQQMEELQKTLNQWVQQRPAGQPQQR